MEKIPFEVLGLNEEIKSESFTLNDKEVIVKSYLPVEEKMSLINIVLQESADEETGLISKIKADSLLHAYIVACYTNIDIDTHTVLEKYDILESNGVIDTVVSFIPKIEYNSLIDYLQNAMSDYDKYRTSVAGIIGHLITHLPVAAREINEALSEFNLDNLSEIMEVVKDMGGNTEAIATHVLGQK